MDMFFFAFHLVLLDIGSSACVEGLKVQVGMCGRPKQLEELQV